MYHVFHNIDEREIQNLYISVLLSNVYLLDMLERYIPEPQVPLPSSVLQNLKRELEQLGEHGVSLIRILFCPALQVHQHLMTLFQTSSQTRQKWSSLGLQVRVNCDRRLVEQYQQVEDWDVKYDELIKNLKCLTDYGVLSKNRVMDKCIFSKVKNGSFLSNLLDWVATPSNTEYKKLTVPVANVQSFRQKLEQQLKAITDPLYDQSSLYSQRYHNLSDNEKFRFEFNLRRVLEFYRAVDRRRHDFNYRNSTDREINKYYEKLTNSECSWLLAGLLTMRDVKALELQRAIHGLKLSLIESGLNNFKIQLKGELGFNKNLLSRDILSLCYKLSNQILPFGANNVLRFQGQLFFKYDLTKINQEVFLIGKIASIHRGMHGTRQLEPQQRQEVFAKIKGALAVVYELIDSIVSNQPIWVYERQGEFSKFNHSETPKLLKLCLQSINSINNISQDYYQLTTLIDQLLISSELVGKITDILRTALKEGPKMTHMVALTAFRTLRRLLMENETKMQVLDNQTFISTFVEVVTTIVEHLGEQASLPSELDKFLVTYVPKLFTFGLQISSLPLTKIYAMKINSISKPTNMSFDDSDQEDQNDHFLMRQQIGASRRFAHEFRPNATLKFVGVFPNSASLFQSYLTQQLDQLEKSLSQRLLFEQQSCPDLQAVSSFLGNQKITLSQQGCLQAYNLIKNYPNQFFALKGHLDWNKLALKLGQGRFQPINKAISDLRKMLDTNLVVDTLPVEALCEKNSSDNGDLMALMRQLYYTNIVLQINSNQPDFHQYVPQLMHILLQVEKIESISLNRIVDYQSSYTQQKIRQIKNEYKSRERNILHFRIKTVAQDFSATCWELIAKLPNIHTNTLIKSYGCFLDQLASSSDLNLVLKIIKITFRRFDYIEEKKNLNLTAQIYNFHKETILRILTKFKSVDVRQLLDERRDIQTVVIGSSLLHFIQRCKQKNEVPAQKFRTITQPHISHAFQEFNEFMFYRIRCSNILLSNCQYRGQHNVLTVKKSVIFDILANILNSFNEENADFYLRFILRKFQNSRTINPESTVEEAIRMQIPEQQKIELISSSQQQRKRNKLFCGIIEAVFARRYSQTNFNKLLEIFQLLTKEITDKGQLEILEKNLLQVLIAQIKQNSHQIDDSKFKSQLLWLQKLLKNVPQPKLLSILTPQFTQQYLKLILTLLKNPNQYKDSLSNSVSIIQKIVPVKFIRDQAYVKFITTVVKIIVKIMQTEGVSVKNNASYLRGTALKLIRSRIQSFRTSIVAVLSLLENNQIETGSIWCELLEPQTKLGSMEADIKGYFLQECEHNTWQQNEKAKQNENIGENEKVGVKRNTFINVFKFKYEDQIVSFSDLTKKIVKKAVIKQNGRDIQCLVIEKDHINAESQILNMPFASFLPSKYAQSAMKSLFVLQNVSLQTLKTRLASLKDLLYYNPILLPYVLLHPVTYQQSSITLIEYLLAVSYDNQSEILGKYDFILQFLLFSCLDHACILNINNRPVFFAEYACFILIKALMKMKTDRWSLTIVYYLLQLKRFALACRLKIDKQTSSSLADKLQTHLQKWEKQLVLTNNIDNILISKIFAIIYKQDMIDNLRECFVPKVVKEHQRDYRFINASLLPYHVYYRKMGLRSQRENYIAFTGTVITPFYPQINEDIYLQEQFKQIQKQFGSFNFETEEIIEQPFSPELCQLQQSYLTNIGSLGSQNRYKSYVSQMTTSFNSSHLEILYRIKKLLFTTTSEGQLESQDEDERRRIHRMMARVRNDDFHGGQMNIYERRRQWQETRQRRGDFHQSRYAAEEIHSQQRLQPVRKKTSVVKQFEESLKDIPFENMSPQRQTFAQVKDGKQELKKVLNEINNHLMILNKPELRLEDVQGNRFTEKMKFLEIKLLEVTFDANRQFMSREEFQTYCMGNQEKLQQLDEARKNVVLDIVETLWLQNIARSDSSDSFNYMMDTIAENYQLLPNRAPSLSKKSSLSERSFEDEQEIQQNFLFESNTVPIRAFSDISEDVVYQMLLIHYYFNEKFFSKQLMPFLQNKKIQNKVINTLLIMLRNPCDTAIFPKTFFIFDQKEKLWKPQDPNSDSELVVRFRARIISVFEAVTNYCFYNNRGFLEEQIDRTGIYGLTLAAREGESQDTHRPLFEVLEHVFACQKHLIPEFLKGVRELPESLIDKLLGMLKQYADDYAREDQELAEMRGFRHRRQRPNDFIRTRLPESILELSKSDLFIRKFRQAYPFGVKDPPASFMTVFLQSSIYTPQQIKIFHLKVLASRNDRPSTNTFLNKVVSIYDDNQLITAEWVETYRDRYIKVIRQIVENGQKLEKEPVYRIANSEHLMNLQIKKLLLRQQLDQERQTGGMQIQEYGRYGIVCQRKKGALFSAFETLRNKTATFWRSPFRAKFIDANGKEETGMGNGVSKQWYTLITKMMVSQDYALFYKRECNRYSISPIHFVNPNNLQYFEFIGKLMALSIIKPGFLMSSSFTKVIYKALLRREITIEDILEEYEQGINIKGVQLLRTLKSSQYFEPIFFVYKNSNIVSDRRYQLSRQSEQIQALSSSGRQFEIDPQPFYPRPTPDQQENVPQRINVLMVGQVIELIPGGASIEVNQTNVEEYIRLYKEQVMNELVVKLRPQLNALAQGFKQIINPKLLQRFTVDELRLLMEGIDQIDVVDFKKHTSVSFSGKPAVLQWFWDIFEAYSAENRVCFNRHWTGCVKMPEEGAKNLGIILSNGDKKYGLKVSTCGNQLYLPNYQTKELLQEAMNTAVEQIKKGYIALQD